MGAGSGVDEGPSGGRVADAGGSIRGSVGGRRGAVSVGARRVRVEGGVVVGLS